MGRPSATTPEEDQEIVDRYQEGESTGELAEEYGVNKETIRSRLEDADIDRRNKGSQYSFNERAFQDLDPETEYWIGFLMADGCVDTSGEGSARIRVTLASKDRSLLEKFRSFLGTDKPINDWTKESGHKSSAFEVSSDLMAEDLKEYGIVPQKTEITVCPDLLTGSRHFWRGAVDGDGNIYVGEDQIGLKLSGTRTICLQFKVFCQSITDTEAIVAESTRTHCFRLSRHKAVDVLTNLYHDAPVALDRKQQKAKEAIEFLS